MARSRLGYRQFGVAKSKNQPKIQYFMMKCVPNSYWALEYCSKLILTLIHASIDLILDFSGLRSRSLFIFVYMQMEWPGGEKFLNWKGRSLYLYGIEWEMWHGMMMHWVLELKLILYREDMMENVAGHHHLESPRALPMMRNKFTQMKANP